MTPKHVKEAFYRDLTGSTVQEVFCLVLSLPLCIILAEVLKSWLGLLPCNASLPASKSIARYWASVSIELVFVAFTQVAIYTELLPAIQTSCTLAALLVACLGYQLCQPATVVLKSAAPLPPVLASSLSTDKNNTIEDSTTLEAIQNCVAKKRRFVSVFRGALMLGTCISILAVDFRVFPRRYAKTEVSGLGFMDMGVGGIVLAGSLVSPPVPRPQHRNMFLRIWLGLKAAAPCWLLWAVRLISVKTADYQEHEGEYGVHWNFFATLAFLALLRHAVPIPASLLPPVATLVACVHQYILTNGDVDEWIKSSTRDPSSWLSLNKEGVGSLPGYWALALAGGALGVALKDSLQPAVQHIQDIILGGGVFKGESKQCAEHDIDGEGKLDEDGVRSKEKEVVKLAGDRNTLTSICRYQVLQPLLKPVLAWVFALATLWLTFLMVHFHIDPVSRRCANLAYILWVIVHSLTTLVTLLAAQLILPCGFMPQLPIAISENMLPVFLLANVLTGLVNMSIDTLQTSDPAARCILFAYVAAICVAAVLLSQWTTRKQGTKL